MRQAEGDLSHGISEWLDGSRRNRWETCVHLRGVVGRVMTSDEVIESMAHQARAHHRLLSLQERRSRTATDAA